ncbi:MAG: tetratricopeptide repeat protein [Limisphaerales bacterium]
MEANQFKDKSGQVWWAAGFLVLFFASALIWGRPLWNWSKTHRAEGFLEQHAEALRKGTNSTGAPLALRSALALAPRHPPVLRAAALYHQNLPFPEVLDLWQALNQVAPLSLDEKALYARAALNHGRIDIAIPLIQELGKIPPLQENALRLGAEAASQQGNMDAAVDLANQAWSKNPNNLTNLWLLASVQFRHPNPTTKAEGRRRLMSLVADGGPETIPVVNLMLLNPPIPGPDLNLLLRLLPARTNAPFEEKLARLGLENLKDPDGRKERLRQLAEPLWTPTGRTNLLRLAEWLSQRAAYQEIVDVIPGDQATKHPLLSLQLAGALGSLERWDDVERLLEKSEGPEFMIQKETFRALGAHATGRTNDSLASWNKALRLSGSYPQMRQIIATLAERRGYQKVSLDAWLPLLVSPQYSQKARSQVLRLAYAVGDPFLTRETLERLHKLHLLEVPDQMNLVLYQALINPDLAKVREALQQAKPLATTKSLSNHLAIAVTLLNLREKKPESAEATLDPLDVDWTKAPTLWRVVRVAQLGKSDRRPEARALAASLDPKTLSKPEQLLVESWLPSE